MRLQPPRLTILALYVFSVFLCAFLFLNLEFWLVPENIIISIEFHVNYVGLDVWMFAAF